MNSTTSTIGHSFHAHWLARLDDEILQLPVGSGCGADCARVIGAALALLEACPDLAHAGEAEEGVICAAIAQCETFFYG